MTSLDDSPELSAYHDEPPQMPSGAPGKNAYLRLAFERRAERSELVFVERRAPLIVQRALYWDEEMPELPCVIMISNGGGMLQGDRYAIDIELRDHAQAHITTQAATKIHRMDANYVSQRQHIRLEEGSYLEYLPDTIIPHEHARFIGHTDIEIAPSATLLYWEILMPGRKYYKEGELFKYDLYSSCVRAARPDGRELFTEKLIIEPATNNPRRNGVMGGFDVFGNVLLLTPEEHAQRIAAKTRATIDLEQRLAVGASRLPNGAGLVFKVLGMEAADVRRRVRELWSIVREEVVGSRAPENALPR